MRIDVVWLGDGGGTVKWPLGDVLKASANSKAVYEVIQRHLPAAETDAWLFWDSGLGLPDSNVIRRAFNSPGDLWHAGLRLGMAGQPAILDAVVSTWMLNRDPDPTIESTSWRLSLRACLARTEVFRQMGNLRPDFSSLEGAALEFGYRCVTRGVIVRHLPWLIGAGGDLAPSRAPFDDGLRLIYYHFGRKWGGWAVFRSLLRGDIALGGLLKTWLTVRRSASQLPLTPFRHATSSVRRRTQRAKVTVLIPTLDRYRYLRVLLAQLRDQTVRPLEIIVIDQAAPERRQLDLQQDFRDLPLRLIYLDQPGQCVARNSALKIARGDFILFLDDDVEIRPDYIESHLETLRRFRAEVSSGVPVEKGVKEIPENFTFVRVSDVFPTGNTLIQRGVLSHSGLFDLAYDHGQRADGDLGMRVYLAGALMVLNPEVWMFHHRAPSGGLRTHNARKITYASSRTHLLQRQLFSATEVYLAKRYFTPRQLEEMCWLAALGTFSFHGNLFGRFLKAGLALIFLPVTLWQLQKRLEQGSQMLQSFPIIPSFGTHQRARDGRQ